MSEPIEKIEVESLADCCILVAWGVISWWMLRAAVYLADGWSVLLGVAGFFLSLAWLLALIESSTKTPMPWNERRKP